MMELGLLRRKDYEPVVLIYRDNDVYAVGIRPHKNHDFSVNLDRENNRPVVIFDSPWHGPLIKEPALVGNLLYSFVNTRFFTRLDNYSLTKRKPPRWFIKDDTKKAIYDYADEIKQMLGL